MKIAKFPFSVLRKKNIMEDPSDSSEIEDINTEEEGLSTTDKMSSIIDGAIENGSYGEMKVQMQGLSETIADKEMLVFDAPKLRFEKISIGLFALVIIGYVYLFYIGMLIHSYTDHYDGYAVRIMGSAAFIFILNALLITLLVREFLFTKRFPKYKEIISHKTVLMVEDIASYAAVKPQKAFHDMKKGISLGLIPQGHFGYSNGVLFISDNSYKLYLTNQEKFNHYFADQIAERNSSSARPEEINKIIQEGEIYIQKIHDLNEVIKDVGITQKLDRMEKVITSIFFEVDINPDYANDLGLILEKHLPMVVKLLQQYSVLGNTVVTDYSIGNSQKEIEETLDTMNDLFEKMLDHFYQDRERAIAESVLSINDVIKAEEDLNGVSIEDLIKKYKD